MVGKTDENVLHILGKAFSFSALTLLGDRQEGHPACKKTRGVGLLVVTIDWRFAHLIAAVVTTISVILSSNKIQNCDILVSANPGLPEKWPLKRKVVSYRKGYLADVEVMRDRSREGE